MKKPEIRITASWGKIGLVREKDFDQAVRDYARRYYGWPEPESMILVPNTMIFTNTSSREIQNWITGDFRQLAELERECQLVRCGGFFVPFCTEAWPTEDQKKVFRPISLNEAYESLFNDRCQPPNI